MSIHEDTFATSAGFRRNQRVELTGYGRAQHIIQLRRSGGRGTVVEVCGPLSIRVLPDGYKHAREYHVIFWQPVSRGRR